MRDFYRAPGDRAAKIRAGGPVLDEANDALGYLEELFPDSIGEACFIDRTGPEIARIVRGERAVVDTLANIVLGPSWPSEQFTASSNILDRVPDRG